MKGNYPTVPTTKMQRKGGLPGGIIMNFYCRWQHLQWLIWKAAIASLQRISH